ncbi:hypothetical protein DIS24_g1646 [Lasiodiplodia hormozganensis]|uniref:54S ribosomal protein L28 n=1 Tax=Lasiodiplodia hormozganensis TaxID=869390 RepID=A0AA39Z2X6_9PEZI|nr:hypothetical protein DIS24_g1646 [Lasiodiplodia hormozganensis]
MSRIATTSMRAFQPIFRPLGLRPAPALPALHRLPLAAAATSQTTLFSTSAALQAKKRGPKKDARITQIRYHLFHPKTPRPLRFSRLRALRHWTIHRAWMMFNKKQRREQELELERQYNSMRNACEALRLIDDNGMPGPETAKNVGRLYRTSMMKEEIWNGVPIEYARPQVDTPSKEGWNHEWKR